MNTEEVTRLLAKVQAYDNRTVGQTNVMAWTEALADLPYEACMAAVGEHHRTSDAYLMPVHIRRIVEAEAKRRREREREDAEARANYRQAIEAGQRGGPTSPAVRALVDQARVGLPDTTAQDVFTRPEWRKPKGREVAQTQAAPNPHYRRTAGPTEEKRCASPKGHNDHVWYDVEQDAECWCPGLPLDRGGVPRQRTTEPAEDGQAA